METFNVLWRSIAISAAIVLATVAASQRPGDLVVTPTRVALDGKAKSASITLLNRGTQTVRYRLNLVDMEMTEDGVLKRVASPTANSGATFFRLSPREIVLQPGESQRIKILAAFPEATRAGEYRSHLSFEPISITKHTPKSEPEGGALSMHLEVRSVVTIPVVARHGQVSATASISDPKVTHDAEGWFARFKITRSGNRSVRGDLTVSFVPAGGGPKVTVGEISSLPVYFPNSHRFVTVRLKKDIAAMGRGQIEITYREPDRSKGAVVAKAVAAIAD